MSAIHCPNCGVLAGVNHGWQKSEPRRDGTPIVAMGNITSHDEDGVDVTPFVAEIFWQEDASGYTGWHTADGMCLERSLHDEVHVHWWIDLPPAMESGVAV